MALSGGTETLKGGLFKNVYDYLTGDPSKGIPGDRYLESALYGFTYVLIWLGLMWILYLRKIFIKLF